MPNENGDPLPVTARGLKITPWLALVIIAYLGCVLVLCFQRGPWLDEFWTMWMTDPRLSLSDAYRTRWATDLHPPLYYFLVWAFRHLCLSEYTYVRMVNFAPFVLVIPAIALWRKYRGNDPWILIFGFIFLSSPYFIVYFAELRSYYALTVVGAVLVILLRIVRSLPEDIGKAHLGLTALTVLTILIALNFHYSASLVFLIVLCAEILISLRAGKYKWAAVLVLATAVSGILLICGLKVTLGLVHNFSYLNTRPTAALGIIISGIALATIVNLGIDIAILQLLLRRGYANLAQAAWSGAILGVAALALFAQSIANRAMSPKYVLDLLPLGASFIADIAANQIIGNDLLMIVMALSALATQGLVGWHEAHNRRWLEYTDLLQNTARACPATQFLGVDQDALPEFRNHPQVSGWIGVFGEGYATVGRISGEAFAVTSATRPTVVVLDKCPLMLLSEHEVGYRRADVQQLLADTHVSINHYRRVVIIPREHARLLVFYP